MREEFLKVDILGTLTIEEVFFFYEEPQVFICTSRFGQKYLSLLTDMDDRQWLLAPVSSAQLALLKGNKVSIGEAFQNSEDDFVWRIKDNEANSLAKAEQIYCKDIPLNDLPDKDVYLDYIEDALMPVLDEEIVELAISERRDIIDLSFLPLNKHIRELDCEALGEALINTQQIMYTLPLPREYTANKIPTQIKDQNAIAAVGTFAASFGIRLKSAELADMFGETRASDTIKLFAELLSAKNDESILKELLRKHSPKTTLRYKKLMQGLLKADLSIKISVASPNKYSFSTEFTKKDIEKNIRFLEDEINDMVIIEEVFGTMVGINVDKKTFAFKSIEEESIIGNLADTFNGVTFEVPKYVKAIFEKKVIWNESIQREKCLYILKDIKDSSLEN